MGRPLNKKYFGTPTDSGNEIKVQFYNGSASVNGWIVKQLGSKKFRVTDGSVTKDAVLTDKASGSLDALAFNGEYPTNLVEMSITVKDDAGVARQVVKIAGRKVTLDTGVSIPWNFSAATDDAAVEMEEAGGAIIAVTAAVNGSSYTIIVPGTTNFTGFGAADSNAGTTFTMANAPGTGTGTVRLAANVSDDFESDE
jgi:hypothetical protein